MQGTQRPQSSQLPVVVIGAGPVGLAAASRLARRDEPVVVLEAGPAAGANVSAWGHVRLFTPWRDVVDEVGRELLRRTDWVDPDPSTYPTGRALVETYLKPLAATPALHDKVLYGAKVVAVSRRAHDKLRDVRRVDDPFELHVQTATGLRRLWARAVVDASGTTHRPNPLGSNGLPARGEAELGDVISYGVPDVLGTADTFGGHHVVVAGSGHSAQNVVLDLVELRRRLPATKITWAIRSDSIARVVGGGASDPIPQRAQLGNEVKEILTAGDVELVTGVEVVALERRPHGVSLLTSRGDRLDADRIVAATGFRPETSVLDELRLGLDPVLECPVKLAPLLDPRFHWCGSVPEHGVAELAHPEPDFFMVGMKSYGRAPTFLLKTGYAQLDAVVAHLCGDATDVTTQRAARVDPPSVALDPCATSGAPQCGGTADRPSC
ncbi:MAG TPA: FAD-dependent oxidoreductase [Actinomycetota bacterium]|nr:FAD-dependent oxidoreductase [Actinomycetota bacterium]